MILDEKTIDKDETFMKTGYILFKIKPGMKKTSFRSSEN